MMSSLRVQKLVEDLFEGNDDFFKQGLLNELNIRKQDLSKQLFSVIFNEYKFVSESNNFSEDSNIKKFINICEQMGKTKFAKIEFKNASIINISESDLNVLKLLFDNLNDRNKVLFAKNLFEEPTYYKQTLEFAKRTKGLIT